MRLVEDIWNTLEPAVRELGVELFDIYIPPGGKGTLRVFISKPGAEVQIEDCVNVSRKIEFLLNTEGDFSDRYSLEVSSPGINRRLRRPEHFVGAVGERVKLVFQSVPGQPKKGGPLVGKLCAFDGTVLEVESESSNERVRVPIEEISSANIDFLFD